MEGLMLKNLGYYISEHYCHQRFRHIFPEPKHKYDPMVKEVPEDPVIQGTHKRRDALYLVLDMAGYFLIKGVEVSSIEYGPSERDILEPLENI
ncbi:hypothetical protein BC332_20749 [Capsicum chinense]|nr:hypothetical protein BC332_20749 [Capsicum chinense]